MRLQASFALHLAQSEASPANHYSSAKKNSFSPNAKLGPGSLCRQERLRTRSQRKPELQAPTSMKTNLTRWGKLTNPLAHHAHAFLNPRDSDGPTKTIAKKPTSY